MVRKHSHLLSVLPLLLAVLALPACSSVKKELGVGRNSPDEFTVVKRAPLTLPPDYELRPPTDPAAAPPPQQDTVMQAREAVLGKSEKPAVKDKAEEALLAKAGATAASDDIRKTIDEENGIISLRNKPVAQKLIFWNDADENLDGRPLLDNAPTSVVDPAKEKERLEKNLQEGKPVNAGNVPVIEKKKSTIDKIF